MKFLKLIPLGFERNLVSSTMRRSEAPWGSSGTLCQIHCHNKSRTKRSVLKTFGLISCKCLLKFHSPERPFQTSVYKNTFPSFSIPLLCFVFPPAIYHNNKQQACSRFWGPSPACARPDHRGHGLNLCTRCLEDREWTESCCALSPGAQHSLGAFMLPKYSSRQHEFYQTRQEGDHEEVGFYTFTW